MEYTNGDGANKPIEILTEEGVRALTGHEGEIPSDIWVALNLDGHGNTYRVEDVLRQWSDDLPDGNEIDRRLRSLRRGIDRQLNPFGADGSLYLVLHALDDA